MCSWCNISSALNKHNITIKPEVGVWRALVSIGRIFNLENILQPHEEQFDHRHQCLSHAFSLYTVSFTQHSSIDRQSDICILSFWFFGVKCYLIKHKDIKRSSAVRPNLSNLEQLIGSCFFHLCNIIKLFSTAELEMIEHWAFISSLLITLSALDRLQTVQNAAARVFTRSNGIIPSSYCCM